MLLLSASESAEVVLEPCPKGGQPHDRSLGAVYIRWQPMGAPRSGRAPHRRDTGESVHGRPVSGVAMFDGQEPESSPPRRLRASRVDVDDTWEYTSMVNAIRLWRRTAIATRGWTSSATNRLAQVRRVA
jgi:hypothetical protein